VFESLRPDHIIITLELGQKWSGFFVLGLASYFADAFFMCGEAHLSQEKALCPLGWLGY